ncbi:heavy metal transporter [Streptomyces sp. NPDC058045]|uniref:heavy metal transporter n=1 Tax=Streptomyces sp. NPDC058045 TaxID=3346311 RepID=UPI0036EB2A81
MTGAARRPARHGRLLRTGAAVTVLLALGGYVVVQYGSSGRSQGRCEVVSGRGDGKVFRLSAVQAVNAATISAVGTSRGMPPRAVTIALATAIQESGLRNLDHGDRDSLGLFQQRPSQGWGTADQIMDPTYSAGRFYEHLAKVPGYTGLPLTVAAQRVQRSGFPEAYAQHEPDARLLSAALTGHSAASLSCGGGPAGRRGDPERVRTALVRDFGRGVLDEAAATGPSDRAGTKRPRPGTSATGRTPAAGPGGAHTVTVPVPAGAERRRRGWELAHWAVANAAALHIERVAYAGRQWKPSAAGAGARAWRAADAPAAHSAGGRGSDSVLIVTASGR